MAKRISELNEASILKNGCCFPLVQDDETKKVSFQTLCNEVAKKNVYSTDETIIGTWINNKPIYRKVVTYVGNDSEKTISTGISNMDVCVNAYGVAKMSGDSIYLPMNFYNNGGWNSFHITNNGETITYQRGSSYETIDMHFVIEYTKTTD